MVEASNPSRRLLLSAMPSWNRELDAAALGRTEKLREKQLLAIGKRDESLEPRVRVEETLRGLGSCALFSSAQPANRDGYRRAVFHVRTRCGAMACLARPYRSKLLDVRAFWIIASRDPRGKGRLARLISATGYFGVRRPAAFDSGTAAWLARYSQLGILAASRI